jgi:hypothetical protein
MLRIALRGLAGALLGALPGSALAVGGMDRQGVGIAVIGAAIGTGLALSRALYGRSATDSLLRGSALFATMTAEKNLPLSGQWSDSLDRVTRPPQPSFPFPQNRADMGIRHYLPSLREEFASRARAFLTASCSLRCSRSRGGSSVR